MTSRLPVRLAAPLGLVALVGACLQGPLTAPDDAPASDAALGQPTAQDSTAVTAADSLVQLRVLLTDAPSDYIGAATVDIGQVSLVPAGDGPHIVLSEDGTDGFVNLLDFQGAATTPLAEAEIEPGEFVQIRMVVEAARVTLADGYAFRDGTTEAELTVPSGAQSGLKLNLHQSEAEGPVAFVPGETVLVLDFDVNQSFVVRGNPETPAGVHGVNFKPAIRVTALDVAASISGTVSPEAEGDVVGGLTVVATPTDGGTVDGYQTFIGTALTADDGSYSIHYLVPGTYEVAVDVEEGWSTDPELVTVTLGDSEDASGVDFTLVDLTGSISGTVSSEVEGVSLAQTVVQALRDIEGAEPLLTEIADDGTYLFDRVLAGAYTVTVDVADGLATDPEVAEVTVGEREDVAGVDFEVLDVTGSIAGAVSTSLENVTVEGVEVSVLRDVEGAEAVVTQTGADGSYLVEGLPADVYTVRIAVGPDQLSDPPLTEVELGPEEDLVEIDFEIIEDRTGSISGTVTTALEGVSVLGLVVSAVLDVEGAEPVTAEVGADGAYGLEGLPAGTYVVTLAVGDGQATDPASREIEVGEDEDVTGADFEVVAGG